MGAITIDGPAFITIVTAVFGVVNAVVVYLFKANEKHVAERIAHVERACAATIAAITDERNFWRDAWSDQRPQLTQRDRLLEKARDALTNLPTAPTAPTAPT